MGDTCEADMRRDPDVAKGRRIRRVMQIWSVAVLAGTGCAIAGPVSGQTLAVDGVQTSLANTDSYSAARGFGLAGILPLHPNFGAYFGIKRATYDCGLALCDNVELAYVLTSAGAHVRFPFSERSRAWTEIGMLFGRVTQTGSESDGRDLGFQLESGTGFHLAAGFEVRATDWLGVGPFVQLERYNAPFDAAGPIVTRMRSAADRTIGPEVRDSGDILTYQLAGGIRVTLGR